MAAVSQLRNRSLALLFGVGMVSAAAVGTHGPAIVAAGAAAIAVCVGTVPAARPIATFAVLLAVLTLVLSEPSPLLSAFSGLCAAVYLVCRYAAGTAADVVIGSRPTLIAAAGFTFAGLVATSFPLQLPWLPLLAPLAVVGIYVLATRPFVG